MSKEFEEWARMEGLPLEWLPNFGFYEATRTEQAWRSWQASRQALVVELKRLELEESQDSYTAGIRHGFNMGIGFAEAALDKAGVSYK